MSKAKLAVIALIVANIIWGTAAPIFKWSLQEIHPFTLAFLRFSIPALIFALLFPHKLKIRVRDFHLFLLAGLLGIGVNISGFFMGLERTASINSPIISSSGPLFILLGAMLFLKEQPSKKMLLGNVIGLTGVLLIILEPIIHVSHTTSLAGNLYLVLATLGSVGGTLVVKQLTKRYDPRTILFWTFFIGSITFIPQLSQELEQYGLTSQLHTIGITGALFGAFLSSLTAYFLYYWSLKYIDASQTTVFTYMDPVAAVLVAAPLIHEYPTPLFLFGTILVFFGIFVAEGRLHYHPIHLLFKKR